MKKFLPKTSSDYKGFTLIELLIVITIIGVLAAIGFAIYAGLGAQAKSRNIKRRTDLDSISKALEVNRDATTGYKALANSQFSNGTIPLTDPLGNEYCANSTVDSQPADPTNPLPWTTCATITVPASSYGAVGTVNPPASTTAGTSKWKICTYLEAEVNPIKAAGIFCKLSSQ